MTSSAMSEKALSRGPVLHLGRPLADALDVPINVAMDDVLGRIVEEDPCVHDCHHGSRRPFLDLVCS